MVYRIIKGKPFLFALKLRPGGQLDVDGLEKYLTLNLISIAMLDKRRFFVSDYNRFLCVMKGIFRSVWRFFYFAFATTFRIIGFFWNVIWGKPREQAGLDFRRGWLNRVPNQLGLRLKKYGEPYQGTCLYVANHISYIDPIVVLKYVEAQIVAKAEISGWPMVGYCANIAGTIFVDRDKKHSRKRAAEAIGHALSNEVSILVFPEGTTSAGPTTLPFRPRSFIAAHEAGVPVQAIAITYEDPLVAYIGKDTFIPHFIRLSRMKHVDGTVTFGPLFYGEDSCDKARAWMDEELSRTIDKTPINEFA